MRHIGLTGGIGSGKSLFLNIFQKMGAHVIDSDSLAGELIKKGEPGYSQLLALFGEEIVDGDGELDRKKVAEVIFKKSALRKKLEKILHPLIIKRRRMILAKLRKELPEDSIVISEASLIFEAHTEKEFDRVILVVAGKDERIKRLLKKGLLPGETEDRMNAQWEDEKKIPLADFVIDNNGAKKEAKALARKIYRQIKRG